jgi:hypothetical protein
VKTAFKPRQKRHAMDEGELFAQAGAVAILLRMHVKKTSRPHNFYTAGCSLDGDI